jgi:ankyrin repeat protein
MKKNIVFEKLVACIVDNNNQKFSEMLEENPIDLNSTDGRGWTLMHYAAQHHAVEIGQILVSKGANINAKDSFGNSVLWRAAFSSTGRGEFIKLLLDNGADKNEKNDSGVSPLELANTISNYNVKQHFKNDRC